MKKTNFTFIDLFAGMGGIRLGLEFIGGKCVFSSEWDYYAQKTYESYFGEKPNGDITKIKSSEIPDHDLLAAGFPCQPFSIIGDKLGFADTRGTLFFEIERILRDKQPEVVFLENVKQLTSHDKGKTFAVILDRLEKLNYFVHWKVLNTLNFGLPQKRERVYIVGFKHNRPFEFPKKALRPSTTLADILESDDKVSPKYFVSENILEKRKYSVHGKLIPSPSVWHENKGGNISPLPYSCALRSGASFNYLLVNGKRRLTPREQLRLQGFPENFNVYGAETQIRKQTGNSVSVPVIEAIGSQILDTMRAAESSHYVTSRQRIEMQPSLFTKGQ